MFGCYDSRHEQLGADIATAAASHAFSAEGSAVAVDRCDTDQSRNLAPIQAPQFWHISYQHHGGCLADSRGGDQLIDPLFEFRSIGDIWF